MKNILPVIFLLFSISLFGQYPNNPVKVRLGYQTTSEGLIYYGSGVPSSSPTGFRNDTYAYIDTLTNTMYLYDRVLNSWESIADSNDLIGIGGGSPVNPDLDTTITSTGQDINAAEFDALLNTYTDLRIDAILDITATSDFILSLVNADSARGQTISINAINNSSTYDINVSGIQGNPSYIMETGQNIQLQSQLIDGSFEWIFINPPAKVFRFENLAEFVNTTKQLDLGDRVIFNSNGAEYKIQSTEITGYTTDNIAVIPNGSNYAVLQPDEDFGINVEWLGAIPGDGLADDVAIQKAIDLVFTGASLYNPEFGSAKVKFGVGDYDLDLGVVVGLQEGSGLYAFRQIEILGAARAYNLNRGPATVINVNNPDGFGFALNSMRQALIKDILFKGGGKESVPTLRNVVEWDDADWAAHSDIGTLRTNYRSPYAAIVIDPFDDDTDPTDQYPDFASRYTHNSIGGSSMIEIYGCGFYEFIVGIMNNPSPTIRNGDNIVSRNCVQRGNMIFWAAGQDQSRGNLIENIYSLGGSRALISGKGFGDGVGTLPKVSNGNIAGGHKFLYIANSGPRASVNFDQVYIESVWALGSGDNTTKVTFSNCDIKLTTAHDSYYGPPLIAPQEITFDNSDVYYYGPYETPQTYNNNVNFINSSTYGGIVIRDRENNPNEKFNDINWGGPRNLGADVPLINTDNLSDWVRPYDSYEIGSYTKVTNVTSEQYFQIFGIGTKTVTVDTNTFDAWFVDAVTDYKVGDVIRSNDLDIAIGPYYDYLNNFSTNVQAPLGSVSEINGDTIVIDYIPLGLVTGSYDLGIVSKWEIGMTFIGNPVASSNQIINCIFPNDNLKTGVRYIGFPEGAYITGISGDTVTISSNFGASVNSNVLFRSAYWIREAEAYFSLDNFDEYDDIVWAKGDRIIGDSKIKICTQAGRVGSRIEPVFEEVAYSGTIEDVNNKIDGLTPNKVFAADQIDNVVHAWGLKKMRYDYRGPIVEITNGVSQKDIYAVESGDLDTLTVKSFCGTLPCDVIDIYDQIGTVNFTLSDGSPTLWTGTSFYRDGAGELALRFNESEQDLMVAIPDSVTHFISTGRWWNPDNFDRWLWSDNGTGDGAVLAVVPGSPDNAYSQAFTGRKVVENEVVQAVADLDNFRSYGFEQTGAKVDLNNLYMGGNPSTEWADVEFQTLILIDDLTLSSGNFETDIITANRYQNITSTERITNPTASQVSVTPSGNLTSTDSQAAFQELQTDLDAIGAGASDGVVTAGVFDGVNDELDFTVAAPGTNFSVDVSALLDNTDAQAISLATNTLSITGNASTVDLSPYLDNTDAQAISLATNTLSITGNASTVDLSPYLDNTDTQLTQEEVQDYVGSMVTGNTEDRITVTYDDVNNQFDFTVEAALSNYTNDAGFLTSEVDGSVSNELQTLSWSAGTGGNDEITLSNGGGTVTITDNDTQLSQATVEDYAGGLFSGNTETLITATYQTFDNTVDLAVEPNLSNYTNDAGFLTSEVDGSVSNELQTLSWSAGTGGNDEITLSDGGGTVTITDNDTQLTQEQVEDIAGAMLTGVQTLITVSYDAVTNDFDFVVNDDLSLYDNTTSAFLTSEVDGSTSNELQTISVSSDDISLSNGGGTVSVINTVESVTAGSTTITVNLASSRNRVAQIDMTSASTASTITLTVNNPVSGGIYTFHFQNTSASGNDVDFPTTFLNAAGTAFDASTTVTYTADDWVTCYYDGTNYHCKQ